MSLILLIPRPKCNLTLSRGNINKSKEGILGEATASHSMCQSPFKNFVKVVVRKRIMTTGRGVCPHSHDARFHGLDESLEAHAIKILVPFGIISLNAGVRSQRIFCA